MTRFAIEILPAAEAEIREAFRWYFERSPIAADAFRTETLEAIGRLSVDALMWPTDEDTIRRHVLRHSNVNPKSKRADISSRSPLCGGSSKPTQPAQLPATFIRSISTDPTFLPP